MRRTLVVSLLLNLVLVSGAQNRPAALPDDLGYRGIWFELNQKFEYGDKYSGGLGTYTAKHRPLAIHAPEVGMTFFVYGGTTTAAEKHLLCMIGAHDHGSDEVLRPTVVHDKEDVLDPHDNPSLLIDEAGHLWVFVSGRGQLRPGFKYRQRATLRYWRIRTCYRRGDDLPATVVTGRREYAAFLHQIHRRAGALFRNLFRWGDLE